MIGRSIKTRPLVTLSYGCLSEVEQTTVGDQRYVFLIKSVIKAAGGHNLEAVIGRPLGDSGPSLSLTLSSCTSWFTVGRVRRRGEGEHSGSTPWLDGIRARLTRQNLHYAKNLVFFCGLIYFLFARGGG